MRNWSIPVGRVFGVEVRVHLTFLFLLVFVWFTDSINAGPSAPLRSLVWVNLVPGAINLLPAYPLDGGRILRAVFSQGMPYAEATRRAVNLGRAFSMIFILAGVWNTWLMLVGIFLFASAQLEE